MKTKNNSKTVEKHLSQKVCSLVINYKTSSRHHKHVILFSITDDKGLLKEINKFLNYSRSRLIEIYPWLSLMEFVSFEVFIIPESEYSIAPATDSYVGVLREQIVVTPYDAHVCDFSFSGDKALFCDIPF